MWDKCCQPHFVRQQNIFLDVPERPAAFWKEMKRWMGAKEKGEAGGDWEEWREGSLWSGCIVWENVCMYGASQNIEVIIFFSQANWWGRIRCNTQTQMQPMPKLNLRCLLLFPRCLRFLYPVLLPECFRAELVLLAEVQAATLGSS